MILKGSSDHLVKLICIQLTNLSDKLVFSKCTCHSWRADRLSLFIMKLVEPAMWQPFSLFNPPRQLPTKLTRLTLQGR
ncbi:hypothetical protein CBW21_05985 [Chromobacterium violaceum]|uniref:Uncharacterized protein n=1 Tax=Chromobacterium violaceum TaxID=536 RepID=A0A202BDL7_CHRVL|nr:hypothetical protein CBW21_05985 [Chromobacterium violaceum]